MQWERAARVLKSALTQPHDVLVAHADDISSAFEVMVEFPALEELTYQETSHRWVEFLDRMSARVAEPSSRVAFDAHRVLAYLAAETPARAIPMLEQTRRDFPRDFNPPARLAKVYVAMKNYPKARTEAAAALALVDGPRTVRVVALAADIEKAAGDVRAERKLLELGVARCKKLWLPPSAEKALAELEKRLSKLPAR